MATSASGEAEAQPNFPRSFILWLSANSLTVLGDAVLYFAIGWAASQYGGQWTGAVLTAIVIPRVTLSLFGGVIGDRFGARRVMIASDALMIGVALALAIGAATIGTPIWMLLVIATLVGVVDAFYMPSSGSMPRRLMDTSLLAKGLALQQITRQGINLIGAPVGGLLVVLAGVAGAALFDASTFVVMLVVMILIRERTIAGLEAARARGLVGGRPTVMTPDRRAAARSLLAEGQSTAAVARALGVSESTVRRHAAQAG